MEAPLYHETQRMMQKSITVVLDLIILCLLAALICSYYEIIPRGNLNLPILIVLGAFLIIVILLSIFLKMDVKVTDEKILVKTVMTRKIDRSEIEKIEVRDKIFAVREYGGWGIRYCINGIGYIAPGNNGGVEVHLKGKKKGIMISSKMPESLYDALR